MQAWKGWTSASAGKMALTWDEWCAWQQRTMRDKQRQQEGMPFTARELAYLSFMHWLHQTGRLGPREPDSN